MGDIKNINVEDKGDFLFRWRLAEVEQKKSKNPLREMIRSLLRELLDVVVLTYRGKGVRVDGFRFLNGAKVFRIFKKTELV